MELVNPNKRAEVRNVVEDGGGQAGQYYLEVSETHGNGTSTWHEEWPHILECQTNLRDTSGMRLKEVQFSRYSEDDKNLSCLVMTNNKGQESHQMGTVRHEMESAQITDLPIDRIVIY